MRAVIQRVSEASVTVDQKIVGSIELGFVVLVGISEIDEEKDADWIADKVFGLRVFEDSEGKMNLSILEVNGAVLLISQFTLFGDCRKGRRPSFVAAARPDKARILYERLAENLRKLGLPVETGIFQAAMEVRLLNDGPVTLLLDSTKTF